MPACAEVARDATLAGAQIERETTGRRNELEEPRPVKSPVGVVVRRAGPANPARRVLVPGPAHRHGMRSCPKPVRTAPGTRRSLTPGPGFRDNQAAMDFRPTAAEERFRREVHDWLMANLPAGWGTPGYRKP